MSRLGHSLLVIVLAGACAPLSAQKVSLPSGLTLSEATRDALNETFDKWQIAPIDPQSVACRTDASAQSFVRGDLNSDGQPDLALAVKTADGVHLVAVFERATGGLVVDVDTLGQSAAEGTLGLEPRGSSFKNPEDGLEDYFTADTLVISRCGQPQTLYFWNGLGFRKLTLRASSPTAALLRLPQHAS